jgi:hypothetical protein
MTDPTDDRQPSPTAQPAEPVEPNPTPPTDRPLRADPDRPADSGWREPAWFPPRDRDRNRDRPSNLAAVIFGLALIAIGGWFFLERTLGIPLPRIQWNTVWPIVLIVIGAVVLLRSFERGR